MSRRSDARHLTAPALAALTALLPPAPAAAQEAGACLAAYENTQLRRMKGEFRAARDEAKTCSQAACQSALRNDCLQWLADLERTIPSVVLEARSERGEEVDVRVSLDGKPLLARLDGVPIELDPGPHTFTFTFDNRPPVEQRVLLKAGEKLRKVSAQFEPEKQEPPPPPPPPPASAPPVVMTRPVPRVVYVMGGVSLLGAGAFAALALSGNARRDDLQKSCAPFCSGDDVNSVRLRYLFADISLGVAVASLGAAAVFYATRPEVPLAEAAPSAPSLGLSLSPRGAALGYRRSF